MDTLKQIYARHSGPGKFNDKNTVHSYLPIYEEIFAPYRETAERVCEIGLFDGHSLRMLEEYFRTEDVYGIDCDEQPHGGMADLRPMIKEGIHDIYILDAADENSVEMFFPKTEYQFDVVIDDAAHNLEQQMKIYSIWKERLTPGALYVIEDIQAVDRDGEKFEALGFKIIDRRKIKGRYDDVLAVIGGKINV